MTEAEQVLALDADIERVFRQRASTQPAGGPVDSLLAGLVDLDEREWPDRNMGSRIASRLVGDRTISVAAPPINGDVDDHNDNEPSRRNRRTRVALALGLATLAAASVILFVFVAGSSTQPNERAITAAGTWRLAGYYQPPGWKQTGVGGPAGPMTCPSATVCYLVSAEPTPNTPGQPLLTLYALSVSHDHGTTWSNLPTTGVSSFTTALQCPDASGKVCLAGGMQGTNAVILTTTDGGNSWAGVNLPPNVGHLSNLACTSVSHCVGVFTASQDIFNMQGNTEVTGNAGVTWFPATTAGALLDTLTCTGSTCISYGSIPSSTPGGHPTYDTFYSHDSGASWKISIVPTGFGLTAYEDQVSCPTPSVCWAVGGISAPNQPSDSGAIARSIDGGATWTLVSNPAASQLYQAISCTGVDDCWTGGSGTPTGQPAGFGFKANADGTMTMEGLAVPLLWNTINGGSTWHLTAIPRPATIPNGSSPTSFTSIGQLTCPTGTVCVAVGEGDGGARYTATYTNSPTG